MRSKDIINEEILDLEIERALVSSMELDGEIILENIREYVGAKAPDNKVIKKLKRRIARDNFIKNVSRKKVFACVAIVLIMSITLTMYNPTVKEDPTPMPTTSPTSLPKPTGVPEPNVDKLLNFNSASEQFNQYVLNLKVQGDSGDELSATEKMLLGLDYYFVPDKSTSLQLSKIIVNNTSINTKFALEVPENVVYNKYSDFASVSTSMIFAWQVANDYDDVVSEGNTSQHDVFSNVSYTDIKDGNGDIYGVLYHYIYDDEYFTMQVPIWLVDDLTDLELWDLLKPKQVNFN